MKTTKTKTDKNIYADIFSKQVKKFSNDSPIGSIFSSLFRLKSEEDINNEVEYLYKLQKGQDDYYKEGGAAHWFEIWHKSVRQCDYFSDCFQRQHLQLITKAEDSQRKFLYDKFYSSSRTAEEKDAAKIEFRDELRLYLELSAKKRRENEDVGISGVMDNILWNLVHADKDCEIHDFFKRLFLEIELELN